MPTEHQLPPLELLKRTALLVDVDGTTTNLERQITARTLRAITQAQQEQLRIGLCTGRQVAQLYHYVLPKFPEDSTHVVGGGGQVVTAKGEVLWKRELPGEIVYQLCQQADHLGCGYGFGVGPVFYANEPLLTRFENDTWSVDARRAIGLRDWSTPLLVINYLNPAMEEVIAATTGIEVKRMVGKDNVAYVDITQQGVDKALGVSVWAELNGLDPADLIGVGDGMNDTEFLQSVGWAVAMKNAVPAIKSIANQVIGHADEDGLAIFIEAVLAARRHM